MFQLESDVIANEPLAKDYWRLAMDAPSIATQAKPGQFVHIKVGKPNDPLLRRPFSIFRSAKNKVEVVYELVGRGTELMSKLKPGDKLDVIGPLGHGFSWNPDKKVQVLVSRGVGSAGLFSLGEEISRAVKKNKLEFYILLSAHTKEKIILEKEFSKLGGKVMIATTDGTYGYKGHVTDWLKDSITSGKLTPSDCAIYACGPDLMFKSLAPICKQHKIWAQVSIEKHMMCGIGACQICVCRVNKDAVQKYRMDLKSSHIQFGEGEFGHALVCKDGPVFNIDEVTFDE